jgi:UDP-N-acetylmuramoyl-L-alanyl-D-glutamate--2,6-diaminopimelate ligase
MFQKIKNIYHLMQAVVANIIYGFPARKLVVIGVTGTDGKTTTTSLIYHILKSAGKKAAMITSVGAYIGDTVAVRAAEIHPESG